MLTALDFPDELLYSKDAIWVRDDGAGSVRLGLNAYAALGEEIDVYFVKLPKGGARIERGTPFGHVDLGRRTVPLIAPVSGSVLFANTDLRAEPKLLAVEPYGRGFLLELDGVDQAEIDGLFDREDAVMFYSRIEEDLFAQGKEEEERAAGFSAHQVIEPGRPFATEVTVRVGSETVMRGRLLPPLGNEVFTPDWVTGDTWAVESKAGGVTRRFAFEVVGDALVAQEEVTCVRAIEVPEKGAPPPPFHRVLHFRVDDHTLAAWDEVSTDDPLAVRRRYNPRGREAWLATLEPRDGFVLDHPKFPVSLDDEARDIPEVTKKPNPQLGHDEEFAISHYVKFRGGLTRIETEMRSDVPREDGRGTERLLSTIVYERGDPWWAEATRMLGEQELVRAKLVKE